ncbi:ATP-grasp fold amidoligase family protein [Sphingomonas sp. GB1N7]|uniref:ATP-grasp fold amidoligase family protein n=1 Tax=Parasphingomonas caseinilytica TaxID=3096158 RepID=UPI002FC5F84B
MFSETPANANDDPLSLARIRLTYLWRHGRLPNLSNPKLFTELVQARKLRDRDHRMPGMADKVAVKNLVADRLGSQWVIPLLWSGSSLPDHPQWEGPIVVKSRHGCNQNAFVSDPSADWQNVRSRSANWMRQTYGRWLDEWLYTEIPRGLLVEPHIGVGSKLPIDYKFYVFDGRVSHVQVHLDRAEKHRWTAFDTNWKPISNAGQEIARPSALKDMIAGAEDLARGFSFARVDFYQPSRQPLFGEICFYPGSGLDPFDPASLDAELGDLWLNAGGTRLAAKAANPALNPTVA